jgi:queuine/archaeosine tRNA-ribosyltransferase
MGSNSLFRVLKTDGAARVGRLTLPERAPIETPGMLLYTNKGSALSLTPDVVAKLPPTAGYLFDAMHL